MIKLRIGLVGLGGDWESRHRPALRALGDRFHVRAVYEQVAHRGEQAARELDATPVDGFRALAERDDVDAILMLAEQWCGSLPILAACDAGKSVYCAAGLDFDPQRARQIRQRIEQSGIAFMAELPCRHAPATLRLKELIATRLGQPRLLFCHRRAGFESQSGSSGMGRTSSVTPRGAIELVDWCRYIVAAEPTSVFGIMHQAPEGHPGGEEDYEMLNLDFSQDGSIGSGPTAQISAGSYVRPAWLEAASFRSPSALQVVCEQGIAFIDLPSTLVWFDDAGRHVESLESERPVGEQLLGQFYRAVTSLVRNTSGADDAFRAHEIVLKARDSHQAGRRVLLDD